MKFIVSLQNNDGFDEFLKVALIGGEHLEITVKSLKSKSWNQIKGIHKLIELLIPRMSEAYGTKFDLEGVKLAIKLHLGYTRPATDDEVLVEAINRKAQLKAMGFKTNQKEFESMIGSIKKDLVKPKSFADATKEEMMELIDKVHDMAARMDSLS